MLRRIGFDGEEVEPEPLRSSGGGRRIWIGSNDGARNDVNFEFAGERLVFRDILVGSLGYDGELRVFWYPAGQMIFWEDRESGAL